MVLLSKIVWVICGVTLVSTDFDHAQRRLRGSLLTSLTLYLLIVMCSRWSLVESSGIIPITVNIAWTLMWERDRDESQARQALLGVIPGQRPTLSDENPLAYQDDMTLPCAQLQDHPLYQQPF
ncbi:uncharacterized protein BCR38DRAFT_432067 [Pseudomassariella vexata]|uniref:Uncharacterized protein n=1 Tax=Pseudomassariella vexata TaxID=1141098 RepID=A0A1Y2E1H6_9PEZI|nr:uncharacterized protein BCR38DRAFT_432067 [Pseudomassariella vexata]ORY65176.1 hypothetical protein BCR38DRAFT_432067 [Pseudomassariella vexata]